ncbi:hypothetical protein IGI04_019674 [Brassica rapa subsp. trilocularis]|uniref:Uncharacterized protein n=1 Tax=Brassica rapa subsp. trilocularis TaxID=1813537 RepID=A0ABQ7MGI6_BRACM|nr:hypothetical protein IGI04_019674 [Brassica rapa subsp. trilocularis]
MTKLTGVRTAEVENPMGHCEQDPSSYQLPQFLRTLLRIPGPAFAPHIRDGCEPAVEERKQYQTLSRRIP